MITWHIVNPEKDEDVFEVPATHPWMVTRYRTHWYWGYPLVPTEAAHFRWYWQANLVSFIFHHLFGYSCNTWRKR